MNATVSMHTAGRLILRKAVRERLHLRAVAKLTLEIVADRIELAPAADTDYELVRKGKRLVIAKRGVPFDAGGAIRAEHESMAAQAIRG